MARFRKSNEKFRGAMTMIAQVMLTIIVILVFAMAFAAQTGTVKLPQWADTWQGVEPGTRSGYAGALLGMTTVIFILFFAAAFIQLVREARNGSANGR